MASVATSRVFLPPSESAVSAACQSGAGTWTRKREAPWADIWPQHWGSWESIRQWAAGLIIDNWSCEWLNIKHGTPHTKGLTRDSVNTDHKDYGQGLIWRPSSVMNRRTQSWLCMELFCCYQYKLSLTGNTTSSSLEAPSAKAGRAPNTGAIPRSGCNNHLIESTGAWTYTDRCQRCNLPILRPQQAWMQTNATSTSTVCFILMIAAAVETIEPSLPG